VGVGAGVEEVVRGAWAGPVTYAAVVMPPDRRIYKLRDSKVLAPGERERLAIPDFRAVRHGDHPGPVVRGKPGRASEHPPIVPEPPRHLLLV
jgi:hypothetical protein